MSDADKLPARMWYFADPMCSWCWGFAPVVRELKKNYGEQIPIALLLGGLRPYTDQPLSAEQREDILHHWRNVQQLTGQDFSFEGALPEGFIYDTEPPSRAVVTVGHLKPSNIFAYLESVHRAFYVEQLDVTDADVLAALAQQQGIDAEGFRDYFDSQDARAKIRLHFERTRQAGVRGFPTLILQRGDGFKLLASGFRPYSELGPEIEQWLTTSPAET